MNYSVAAQCLTGLVRRNNEDNFSIDGDVLPRKHTNSPLTVRQFSDQSPHLMGVFDGMGGHRDGETASWLAASTVAEFLPGLSAQTDPETLLEDFCMTANDKVCIAADGSQMGTTCALLCLKENSFTLCNVGDSPIFLIRDRVIRQISVDHNQRTTYEKVTGKPARPGQKFKLTQCIGIPPEEMLIEPYVFTDRVRPDDLFLLCSDGLTDMVPREEILRICLEETEPERMIFRLTEKALAAGGNDNITILCILAERPEKQGLDGFWTRLSRRIKNR